MLAVAPPCRLLDVLQRERGTVKVAVTVGVGVREAEVRWREERRKGARKWVDEEGREL